MNILYQNTIIIFQIYSKITDFRFPIKTTVFTENLLYNISEIDD